MSVTQKMFACCGVMLVVALEFSQAIPVPAPEDVHPENERLASVQTVELAAESAQLVADHEAARPVRSASPFFGIITGYEKPHKTQQHHHHHYEHVDREPEHHKPHYHQHEVYESEHHRPQYHHEVHEPHYHKPQHHHKPSGGGGGAGSFASAGSFAGGSGGGAGHSQSAANSQSASFGFGPFQASYSASSAHSGSHSGVGFASDY